MDRFYRVRRNRKLTRGWLDILEWISRRNALPFAIAFFLLGTSFAAFGQSAGDYRSRGNGNWTNVNTWQYYTGGSWTNATTTHGYPGEKTTGAAVNIQNDVTLNVSPANNIGNLVVNNQALLNTAGNFSLIVDGNVSIARSWIIVIIIPVLVPADIHFANGDLTISGTLDIENACSLNMGTGQLSISGATTIDAGGELTNNGKFASSSTVAVGGNIFSEGVFENNGTATLNNPGSAVLSGNGTWTQGTNATLNYAGSTLTVGTLNASATGNLINYYRNGIQGIVPSTYHNLSLTGTGAKTAGGSFSVRGDFEVSGTATFQHGSSTVTLNGSVAQNLSVLPTGITFNNLTINNTFGASPQITLNGGVTVTGTLTMTDGNINLNGNNFTIGTSAAATGTLSHNGSSTRGWMYGGNLIRYMANASTAIGNVAGFFPLGSASSWRPFYVGKNNLANSGGLIAVSHTNSTSTSTVTTFPEGIVRRHNSFWNVSTSAVSAGTWSLSAGGTNFGIIGSVLDLRMTTSTGVVGTHSNGSGSTTDPRVNRTGLTYAQLTNNFHVASTNATNSPLPIELLSFSAQLQNNFVDLKWSTATETNNNFFTIERSSNVEHFEPILQIDGAGTTKELNAYNVIDPSPLYGRSYYRLKQTDFDGKFTYSSVRVIDYEGPEHSTLTVFPNPSSGKNLSIKIEGLRDATHVPLLILNMQGQKLYEKTIRVKTPGVITEEISREKVLPSGVYVIKAGNTLYLTKKIVIK